MFSVLWGRGGWLCPWSSLSFCEPLLPLFHILALESGGLGLNPNSALHFQHLCFTL